MRPLITLAFLMLAASAMADIGASLDSVKKKYGAITPIRRAPDSASFACRSGDATVEIVLTPSVVSRINVFFPEMPREAPETLLERFSGRKGWTGRPLDDPEFKRQFPFASQTPGERFYTVDEVYALVKLDAGGAKLMLLIQTAGYLNQGPALEKRKMPNKQE